MKESGKGRIALIAAAILWGMAGVCVKSITWNSMQLIASRSFLSFFVLAAFKKSFKMRFSKQNILGALFQTATGMLYVQSIKLTTAGSAIVLQYIAPILVFFYAVLFQHRKAKPMETLCALMVFLGVVLSFADSLDPTRIVGNLLGLASGVTFAAQIIAQSRKDADSGDSLMLSCLLSFVIAMPVVLLGDAPQMDVTNIFWVLVLGIFQYGLANALFAIGIKRVDKVEGSLLLTIEPIFNPIPVAILCGEKMGTLALIGAAVVIAFVALYSVLPQLEARRKLK